MRTTHGTQTRETRPTAGARPRVGTRTTVKMRAEEIRTTGGTRTTVQ
jgi:hypothetical protein